jgi:hypothetical protein
MRKVTQRMRINVELQGFVGLSDCDIGDIYYWLRLGALLGLVWTAAGVIAQSAVMLWALVPISASGAFLRRELTDEFYMRVVRPRLRTAAIPVSGPPRRFTCLLMAVWLALTGACFAAGAPAAGFALGAIALAEMAVQVVSGYCVPAALYGIFARREA